MNPASIFGKSLSFPPRVGADGRFVWSAGETLSVNVHVDQTQRQSQS